jgi:hypothetical protein
MNVDSTKGVNTSGCGVGLEELACKGVVFACKYGWGSGESELEVTAAAGNYTETEGVTVGGEWNISG